MVKRGCERQTHCENLTQGSSTWFSTQNTGSQSAVARPALSSGDLLDMQSIWPQPRLTESEALRMGLSHMSFHKLSRWLPRASV